MSFRSHSVSIHVGRLDDCFRFSGQDGAFLGPQGAQLCPSCRDCFPWLRCGSTRMSLFLCSDGFHSSVPSLLHRESCGISGRRSKWPSPSNRTGRQRMYAVWRQRRTNSPGVPSTLQRRAVGPILPRRTLSAHWLLWHEGHGHQPARYHFSAATN